MLYCLIYLLWQLGDFLEQQFGIILGPWFVLFLLIVHDLLSHAVLFDSLALWLEPVPQPSDRAREHFSLAPVS